MTQKKINGYVIFMKEVLGKGSYGSVLHYQIRFIEGNKIALNYHAQ